MLNLVGDDGLIRKQLTDMMKCRISGAAVVEQKNELSTTYSTVAAHLRGMRPTLTARKDPLMLRRNSNILLLLLNFHNNSIMYFNCCAYTRIRI